MLNQSLWLLTLLVFSFSANIFAETITLKSGQTLEGKIIERTGQSIKLDTGVGVVMSYDTDDIDAIDGQKLSAIPVVSSHKGFDRDKFQKTSSKPIIGVVFGLFGLIGGAIFIFGFNRMSKLSLIQNIPRSKIRSMSMGLVEIQGNALADKYLATPFSQSSCVYYKYFIQEYRAHLSKDANGNTQTSYRWDTVSSGEQSIPFFGKDDTGQVLIDPQGAEFNVTEKKVFLQQSGFFGSFETILNDLNSWHSGNAASLNVSGWGLTPLDPQNRVRMNSRVGDRMYQEFYIEPEENIFIIGTAANDPTVPDRVLIKKGEGEPTFIISNESEKKLLSSMRWQMISSFILGGIILTIGIVLLLKLLGTI